MTKQNHPHSTTEKFITAYNDMMERVKTGIEMVESDVAPRLHSAIDKAQGLAMELDELTHEEAEKIGNYLKRDIEDAADYLTGPEGQELHDWLRFDLQQVESQVFASFLSVADQTKLDLMKLEQQAASTSIYHSGEITGIGTLACSECGKQIHFHKAKHIPPCPSCNNRVFIRCIDDNF